jgi:hypothetical protein
MSSSTTLASRLALRRWTLGTLVGYQLAGGADAEARTLLPLQRGPFGEASADYAVSRRDHALATVSASETTFSSGPEAILVLGSAGYRLVWSRALEARLALGAGEAQARTSARAPQRFETEPVIEGALESRRTADGRLGAFLGARLGPTVNRLVGFVDERLEGTLAASYQYRRLTTRVLGSASASVPFRGPNAATLVAGELSAAYGATRVVAVDGGLRGVWQRQDVTGGATFGQGTLFIGVTLRAPPTRW